MVQIREDMPFDTDFKRRYAPADDVEIKIRKDTSYDSKARIHLVLVQIREDMPPPPPMCSKGYLIPG